ncbi:MAG TPA: ABC transporter ATP-binding protein [Trebonia sp.]|nr:ABC transporter ATP-binding protein [Trebonia sp.]
MLLEVVDLAVDLPTPHGPRRVVREISFFASAGESLGIVGESGSGKTMTALALMGLLPDGAVVSGELRFEGRNLAELGEAEMQKLRGDRIAMIFQEPMSALNPLHRIGAQVAEPLTLHRGLSKAAAWREAVRLLDRVQLRDPAGIARAYPFALSGGERQRAMIAMALSCRPRLIIADEPTTALDVTIQAQVLELLRELRDTLGMAVLLITHDLGVVAEMADDVAVMYAGRIVERGNVQDTFARPQHPYTQALLRSIPVLGMRQDQRLTVIPGMVPSPASWPSGCRFEARCDQAFDRCGEYPPLFDVGLQAAACWHRDPAAVVAEATNR